MARAHEEELVYTSSEDGLLLEGVAMRPRDGQAADGSIALVWIHGNASRFYDYPYVAIGRALAGAGIPVISANTRGHDISAFLWRARNGRPVPWSGPEAMPIGGGSGWERLEEAPRDLAAWVDLAAPMAPGGVVLAGHSSGAQRVVLYQAERQDPRVVGLVLASPDLRGFLPPTEVEAARRLVAEGRGLEVTPPHPFAPWYRQSAQTVVSKATIVPRLLGATESEPIMAAIRCPVLALYGAREPGAAETLETIRSLATGAAGVETAVVEDADHVYSGCEAAVARVITGVFARWARKVD